MNAISCVCLRNVRQLQLTQIAVPSRLSNTLSNQLVEKHRKSRLSQTKEKESDSKAHLTVTPRDYKFIIPEFIPDPNWMLRDRIKEMLERKDMIHRRSVISIPEYYVGSVLAVTVSDPYAAGKKSRFVGICIHRGGHGLRAQFTLRNIIESQGVEIMYEMYNPTIRTIEVLKLERRLDDELFYLRDAPAHYSTVPFDMEPIVHPPGAPIPVNPVKVDLGPRPWSERWERMELKGVSDLRLPQRFYDRASKVAKPWEKYDMMKHYRDNIPEPEADDILRTVYEQIQKFKRNPEDREQSLKNT